MDAETTVTPDPDRIESEVRIDAPVGRVWDIVTRAEHLGRWFADAGAEIDLRVGGQLRLTWAEYGTFHARVVEVAEPTRLAFRWAKDPDADPDTSPATLVELTLSADGEATVLRVVESGFTAMALARVEQQEYREGNVDGWHQELGDLVAYLQGQLV